MVAMARLIRLRERARETLWLAPVLGLLLALGLSVATIEFDDVVEVGASAVIGFDGGPDSARAILSTIATSMLTFLALVFTLTVVALQLASDYSPRLLRSFLSAPVSKVALGLFVATFTYSVLVLREVSPENVPELSVTIAIVLAILAVIVFVYYVSDIAQSLRVASIVERAGEATREEIERSLSREGAPGEEEAERDRGWQAIEGAEPTAIVEWDEGPGIVTAIDLEGLRGLAASTKAIIELRAQVGDFVPARAPVAAVFGESPELDQAELVRQLAVSKERTFRQDAAFGLRQLVDVAIRALSPGINDPTTAVQALDQIHDILLGLGSRRLYPGVLRGDDGEVRVLVPVHSWDDYVHLAVDEIRIYGEGSLQLTRRLLVMLRDLASRLPPSRAPAVELQLDLLGTSIEAGFENESDRQRARLLTSAAGGSEGGG
jgi:uncharacterized membrane protein